MLKLHYHPLSTFSRRVLIAFIEKGIEAELVELDMPGRAHRSPAYLAINPYGRVPTLDDNGFVLYESTAILDYLESTHPDPPLVPSNPRGRALVSMHMKLCDLQLCRPGGMIIFPKRFLPPERWDETVFAQCRKEIDMHLAVLEKQLEGKQYVVEDRYSLVEVCYAPFVEFFPLMDITPPPAVAAWAARISERPSAVRTRPAR